MFKWMRRMVCLLICVALVSAEPVAIAASTLSGGVEPDDMEYIGAFLETDINPEYADVLTEEDLVQPSVAVVSDEIEYCTTVEEAADVVRPQLVARAETVTVGWMTQDASTSPAKTIFYMAMEHTGQPKEGDYIFKHYGGYKAQLSYYYSGGTYYITYTYTVTWYTTAEQEAEMDTAVEALLNELSLDGLSDYAAVKTIYDWMTDNITYDYDSTDMLKYSAYAALVNKTAVCQGYATLLYRLVLEAGIDTRVVRGTADSNGDGVSDGGHAWNIICLDGVYYCADATWDVPRAQLNMDYDYFLRSGSHFAVDHFLAEDFTTEEFTAAYPMAKEDYKAPTVQYSGTLSSGLTWELYDDGTLVISGSGSMGVFSSASDVPWSSYSSQIKNVVIKEGVTTVGSYAFSSCTGLTSMKIPASVTEIGAEAFYDCGNLSNIRFLGDAPQIDASAFHGVKADAYYPVGNDTWTENVMQDYGGTITWWNEEKKEENLVIGSISKNYWTMSLDSVIYLNYYVNLSGFAEDVDFETQGGVIIWTGSENPTSPDQVQIGLENCQVVEGMYKSEDGNWYVRSNEIYAKNLGDWVYLRAYVEIADDVYVYGPVGFYSPLSYCTDILNNENERYDTRRVCAALLEYGAAAQVYFGYKTDNLVTAGFDFAEYNLGYDSSYVDSLVLDDHITALSKTLSGTRKGITYKKSTLDLAGAIRLSAGFDIDSSVIDWNDVAKAEVLFWSAEDAAKVDSLAYDLHNYTYACELTPATGEETVNLGDYLAQSHYILAKNLGETVYYSCRIEMKDGTVYRNGLNYYSPESFASDHIRGSVGQIVTVCERIIVYSEMARLRFAENEE